MIIITGQTATGKTKLALELAQKHNGEIINCDSRQKLSADSANIAAII